jgi:hypothetical protein
MKNLLSENSIEELAMELLGGLGYDYLHGTVIAHDGENPERANYQEALLQNILSDSVRRINPDVPAFAQAEAVKEIQRIHSPELLAKKSLSFLRGFLFYAVRTRLELATPCVTGMYSNQLNYRTLIVSSAQK